MSIFGVPLTRQQELSAALTRIGKILGGNTESLEWDPLSAADLVQEVFGDGGNLRVDALEKWAIQRALRVTRGNCRAAARKLGISKTKLYRKIRDLDLEVPGR